jgi:hypothetical protein
MDNRLGNTNKLGALFGLLSGIGVFVPHPQPGQRRTFDSNNHIIMCLLTETAIAPLSAANSTRCLSRIFRRGGSKLYSSGPAFGRE